MNPMSISAAASFDAPAGKRNAGQAKGAVSPPTRLMKVKPRPCLTRIAVRVAIIAALAAGSAGANQREADQIAERSDVRNATR